MVIPGLQSSTARGSIPITSHYLVLRVHSPQHQLWGWLGSRELPFVTTETRAAAQLVSHPWGRLWAACAVQAGREQKGYQLGCLRYLRCLSLPSSQHFQNSSRI